MGFVSEGSSGLRSNHRERYRAATQRLGRVLAHKSVTGAVRASLEGGLFSPNPFAL